MKEIVKFSRSKELEFVKFVNVSIKNFQINPKMDLFHFTVHFLWKLEVEEKKGKKKKVRILAKKISLFLIRSDKHLIEDCDF